MIQWLGSSLDIFDFRRNQREIDNIKELGFVIFLVFREVFGTGKVFNIYWLKEKTNVEYYLVINKNQVYLYMVI